MADAVLSIIGSATYIIIEVYNRLDQLKQSENVVVRIKRNVEYLDSTIKRIEEDLQRYHNKKEIEIKELKEFLSSLKNASEMCVKASEKSFLSKLFKTPSYINMLSQIEADITMASSHLNIFINRNHFALFLTFVNSQNQNMSKIVTFQVNSRAGITIIEDKSVNPPPAPHHLSILEEKNALMLSWECKKRTANRYEICYDEHNDYIVPTGKSTSVRLEPPTVIPGKTYVMKVRGINKGGKGEWSDPVIGQLMKPFPQKPEISNLLLRSTMAVVTVKIAEAICSTESPVTCVEVSYSSMHTINESHKLINDEFIVQPGETVYKFTIKKLQPDSNYNFTARSKNAEGWSNHGDFSEGKTLSLPALPARPNTPTVTIEDCTPAIIKLVPVRPENTCKDKSPIITWKVYGYGKSCEKVEKYFPQHEEDFVDKECKPLYVKNLNPYQQYTLRLLAENENGWSEPSEIFKINIAVPFPPENFRVSSKRSHSIIKLRWNTPESSLINEYEIKKTSKKGKYDEQSFKVSANKLSVTFTKLTHNTKFYFKIRSWNKYSTGFWSYEIEANTRIHKALKAAFSPVVWALGTITSPISTPVLSTIGAGYYLHEEMKVDNKAVVAAGATGMAVYSIVGGTAFAPIVGATWAHMFVHGLDELSDQSEDEDAVII